VREDIEQLYGAFCALAEGRQRTRDALAAKKAQGVKLGGLNAKGIANRDEAKARAEALRPVLTELAGMSANAIVQDLCQQARQALSQGEAKSAQQFYLQALAQKPDAADIHYGLGTTCFVLADHDGAVYHFQQTLSRDPHKVGAYINLGAVDVRAAVRGVAAGSEQLARNKGLPLHLNTPRTSLLARADEVIQ
jgi:tetratricopeptide (TPR) repeat protein